MPTEKKDFKERIFDFYKEAYTQELELKEKITGRLTLNLAVLSVIANISVYFLDALPLASKGCLVLAFYTFVGIAILLGLVALAYFFRAIGFPSGYEYGFIPKTTEIYQFLRDAEHYNETAAEGDKIDLEAAFRHSLSIQYNGYSSRNAEHNHRKSRFIWVTFLFSVWSLISLLLATPLFYILRHSTTKPPQAVD